MSSLPSLRDLSFIGTDSIELSEALRRPERARAVELGDDDRAADLKKLRRLYRLVITADKVPSLLAELSHLRSLTISTPSLERVPAAVFLLPRLESLFLEDTSLLDLSGLESSPSLTTVIFRNTPLEEDEAKRAALLARLSAAGWRADDIFQESGLARKSPPAKFDAKQMDKADLLRALNDDRLPGGGDLSTIDLSGATIEDAVIDQKLTGAQLAHTTWRGCDFLGTRMSKADLRGAVFEDCAFEDVKMEKAIAAGAVFRRCALHLDLTGADLTGARFTDLEPCPHLELAKANLQRAVVDVMVLSEREIEVSAAGADLRGARITVDLDERRRRELTKKTKPRPPQWASLPTKGARTDDATQIVFVPLPGSGDIPLAERRRPAGA